MNTLALKLAATDITGDIPEGREAKKGYQKKVIAGVELSEETIDEIKEAFLEFDMDCDGTITTKVNNIHAHQGWFEKYAHSGPLYFAVAIFF